MSMDSRREVLGELRSFVLMMVTLVMVTQRGRELPLCQTKVYMHCFIQFSQDPYVEETEAQRP